MKLVSHHLCPYVQRAVIILLEKDIPHERTYIDLSNKPNWFLDLSPLGRVPVLEVNGSSIFESQVIVEYLDETTPGSLHPSNPLERARHRAWIEFGSATLNSIGALYNASDKEGFIEADKNLRSRFEVIEREIEGPLFGGERLQIIDAAWGPIFRYFDVFDRITNIDFFDGLRRVVEWRERLSARCSVIEAVPSGYENRLATFLEQRNSYISSMM